jgi:hypothetical protein
VSPRSIWEQEAFANVPFPAPGREVREAGACSRDHLAELYIVVHPSCSFSSLHLRAGVAQQDDGAIERPRFDERELDRCVELAEE